MSFHFLIKKLKRNSCIFITRVDKNLPYGISTEKAGDQSSFVNVSYERFDVGKRLSSLYEWDRELMAKNFTTIFMEMIFWILFTCVQIYRNIFIYLKRYWEQRATYFQTHKTRFFFSILGFSRKKLKPPCWGYQWKFPGG